MLVNSKDYSKLTEFGKRQAERSAVISLVNEFGSIKAEHINKILGVSNSMIDIVVMQNGMTNDDGVILSHTQKSPSTAMLKALDLLSYFSCVIDWYSIADFPFYITFSKEGKVYDIGVMTSKEELILRPAIMNTEYENLYLIVDNKEQIETLSLQENVWFVSVDPMAMLGSKVSRKEGSI